MTGPIQEIHKTCGTPLRRRILGTPSHIHVVVYCPKCNKEIYSIDFDISKEEYRNFSSVPALREKMIGDAMFGKRQAVLKNLEDVL